MSRAGALGDRTTLPPHTHPESISSAGYPNSSPCLHSCILLAFFPQLCCQVQIFPLPPPSPFLGPWKSKVFVYLSLRTRPLSVLPGETLEHLAELTLRSWSVYSGTPPSPPCSHPQFQDMNKVIQPPLTPQDSVLNGLYTSFHFIFKQPWEREFFTLHECKWGCQDLTSGQLASGTTVSLPAPHHVPLCFYGKQRGPESTMIFSVFLHPPA